MKCLPLMILSCLLQPTAYDHHRSYFSYHDYALTRSNPGYFKQYNLLTLETNLCDVTSGELV